MFEYILVFTVTTALGLDTFNVSHPAGLMYPTLYQCKEYAHRVFPDVMKTRGYTPDFPAKLSYKCEKVIDI